jgi:hypothetical protein
LWGGTLAGLRYAWHSETILAQLVRTAAYAAAGSALWACCRPSARSGWALGPRASAG